MTPTQADIDIFNFFFAKKKRERDLALIDHLRTLVGEGKPAPQIDFTQPILACPCCRGTNLCLDQIAAVPVVPDLGRAGEVGAEAICSAIVVCRFCRGMMMFSWTLIQLEVEKTMAELTPAALAGATSPAPDAMPQPSERPAEA